MANVYMGSDVEDFIFGEGRSYEECTTTNDYDDAEVEVTEEEMNMFGVIECVDDPEVACYRIALENEQNYNMLINAMMIREFSVLESTGEEMVYEAVDIKSFFAGVQEAIGRFWAKIKGMFKAATSKVQDAVMGNKAFVKKYKNESMSVPTKFKTFNGYDFSKALKGGGQYTDVVDVVEKAININAISNENASETVSNFRNNFDVLKDKMRGAVIGKSISTSKNFTKELKVAFYGSSEKENVKLRSFADLIEDLENAKTSKANIISAYKGAFKAVQQLRKNVKTAEKEFINAQKPEKGIAKGLRARGESTGAMKVAKCYTDAINASIGIMSMALGVEMAAAITKTKQDKAMAVFYVSNQPNSSSTTTQTTSTEESAFNFNFI